MNRGIILYSLHCEFARMQLLEINYKALFETFPGYHALLMADSPIFTVAAITEIYLTAASTNRELVIGRGIFDSGVHHAFMNAQAARNLAESLQYVAIFREPHSFDISKAKSGEGISSDNYLRFTNTPLISSDGDIQYIVHTVTEIAAPHIDGCTPKGSDNQGLDVGNKAQIYSILMQSPVAMGIVRGKDLVWEMANPAMMELVGKGPEIIGQPLLKALPELASQMFPKLLENVYATGTAFHGFETSAVINKNDHHSERYFNFVYTPLRDYKGNVYGVMMVAADVTTLVKAKKELEESKKRYQDLIANATVATAIYVGEDMVIQLANDSMIKLWGKDASVIGMKLRDAIPELEGQPFHELLHEVYTTGVTYHSTQDRVELVVDGRLQPFYFNFTYKALRDTTGKIYGILNMAVDVSELVKTKIEINDAEERWRLALHSAELGTWDFYPITNQLECSVRTKELFGLPGFAKPDFDMLMNAIHPRHRNRVRSEIRKVLDRETHDKYLIEYCVIGIEDKKERWQRASGQAFYNEEGKAYLITGTVLDITDRKRIEESLEERVQLRTKELLEANKELERSNLELEQYAYVASHDLQEPLRKILVYTDLMKKNILEAAPTEYVRLEKVISSAQRMTHLINDLLNFSRLLKTENVFVTVNLNDIIHQVVEDFDLKIQETKAQIKVEPLPLVEASVQQMGQLFYNLISNALKFRKDNENPDIHIYCNEVPKVAVETFNDLDPSLQYVDVVVKDNGIGFGSKYVTQIFEIFKRLHTRSAYEGTGIGLALCRRIVRNHRGDIYAISSEGAGAEFHVLLPLKQSVQTSCKDGDTASNKRQYG